MVYPAPSDRRTSGYETECYSEELQNVIVAEELRNETPHPENYALTLEKIKRVELEGLLATPCGMIDVWYKFEIKTAQARREALQTTLINSLPKYWKWPMAKKPKLQPTDPATRWHPAARARSVNLSGFHSCAAFGRKWNVRHGGGDYFQNRR